MFEWGHVIRLWENRFSFNYIVERLGRNGTVHNCWQQWFRESADSRRPAFGQPHGITKRGRSQCSAYSCGASYCSINSKCNWYHSDKLLQINYFKDSSKPKHPMVFIPLTQTAICNISGVMLELIGGWRWTWNRRQIPKLF